MVTLQVMKEQTKKKSRIGIILKTATILLLLPIIFVGGVITLLYIPPIQNYAVKELSRIVNEESDFNVTIGAFHLSFPLRITIDDFILSNEQRNLAAGEQIEISIRPYPLLRGEVELNYISIDNTAIESDTLISGIGINGDIGHLRIVARNIDLLKETVDIRQIHLSDTRLNIAIEDSPEEEPDTTHSAVNWIIGLRKGCIRNLSINLDIPQDTMSLSAKIDKLAIRGAKIDLGAQNYAISRLSLKNSEARYDTGSKDAHTAPLDHLHFENINIDTGRLLYASPHLTADITNLTLHQKDGMQISKGRLSATGDTAQITLHTLAIETSNGTSLNGKSVISWDMIEGKDDGLFNGNISAFIDKRDIKGFISDSTYAQLSILPDSMLNIAVALSGTLDNISVDTLDADIPHMAHIAASGFASNLTHPDGRHAELAITGQSYNIGELMRHEENTDSLTAARTLSLAGRLGMLGEELYADIDIISDSSLAHIAASYHNEKETYSAKANIDNLNLIGIMPDIPLHKLTMRIEADGEGTDIFDASTNYRCDIAIDTLCYDRYLLQDIHLSANQADSRSHITLNSNDPTLQANLRADTRIDSTAIASKATLTLEKADFEKLGITQAPLTASMVMYADATTDMQQTHRLKLTGDKFKLITKQKTFTPSRLDFDGSTSPDTSFVNINTGDLKIKGALSSGYQELFAALDRVSQMYNEGRTQENTLYYVQDFEKVLPTTTLDIDCGQKNILANYLLFNNIKFNDFSLRCSLDSIKGINAHGGLHGLQKDNFTLDTIRLSLRQDGSRIKYFTGVRSSAANPENKKLKFYAALFGNLENDTLKTNFVFRDNRENIGARIGLNTRLKPEGLNFHFDPDAILFNNKFRFNEDNYLNLGKNMSLAGNIEFTDSIGSGMHLYTTPDTVQWHNISLELFNIDLQAVTRLLPFAPDISGMLNADLTYSNGERGMFANADIRGKQITYEGTLLGDETVELSYLPKGKETHYLNLVLLHNRQEVLTLSGDYHNDSIKPGIDGRMNLKKFPLQISAAFLNQSGMHLNGYIDGELSVDGPLDNTNANGYIRFDSVYAHAPMFGTQLHLVDDKVEISDNKLKFNNFNIYAKGSTPFKINGTVDIDNLLDPAFNLRMQAKDYELINATRKKGVMLYGRMFLDVNAFVGGTLNAMRLFGSATLLGNSDITYVLQDSPLAADNELDGLVEFVNFADTTKTAPPDEEEVDLGNVTINMTLQIEEGARINADFDEGRNSYIELQGEGNLSLAYTGEAGMNLTGRYTLSNGQLKYSLPVIPLKTFNINDGSYINWTGDIADPTINITALERVTSSVTLEDGNTQAVAFDVGVILTNTLSNMGLSFTLSAPENAAVQNELNSIDKETLNKYAVTMLITGAYLGNNGGLTVSNALSSFLDAKINDLAGNAMKSVSINVGITDVENQETGDTYKNYSFSFAKRFWNDRLTVVIGGEVNSGKNANENNNESFINNVSLEWKISESGNRYIRLFYDKNYESILEGEIIETGIGYIYKRKMNKLNELFIFRRKNNDTQQTTESPNKENKK